MKIKKLVPHGFFRTPASIKDWQNHGLTQKVESTNIHAATVIYMLWNVIAANYILVPKEHEEAIMALNIETD